MGKKIIQIDKDEMLREFGKHRYTRKSMGEMVGCTGQCIGVWLRKGQMPEDLFNKIQRVLQKHVPEVYGCGCKTDGDLFLYKGKEVWINIQEIYDGGWNDCKNAIIDAIDQSVPW